MNEEGTISRMLPEHLNSFWLPLVFEAMQMLLWVLAVIALLSLIVVLVDLILLCRQLNHPKQSRPATGKQQATNASDAQPGNVAGETLNEGIPCKSLT